MRNKFFKMGITTMALCMSQMAFADGIYTIYPIPQQQQQLQGSAQLTPKVNVILESGIDESTKNRLIDVLAQHKVEAVFSDKVSSTLSNIYLGINGSGEIADQMGTTENLDRKVFEKKNKFDRHCVSLTAIEGKAQILILGENTDATFFGLASLEQMLDRGLDALPCIHIYDYADQKSRGIVEGYYGYPYTVEVKKDLMRYMMRFKMNTYMYGAKSDPYHSQYWKDPYPTKLTDLQIKNGWLSQDMVKDLTQVSHDTKVNFIWAIHPGNSIMNSSTVVKDVMSKFNKMYQLGVRQFAVFVDDVGVPKEDAEMKRSATNVANIQKEIEKKYNTNYTAATDTVRPLHFVPQVYCSSWVGEDQRKRFFKSLQTLPKNVTVYTTGWGVWSVPNQNDFNLTASELGRPAAWWWNYPCNDNADAQVFPMDMYSNFYDMPSVNDNAKLPRELTNGLGIVCNPMQQGEISKIPLFSAADYAWNTSGFNNLKSWNAAFPAIIGEEKADALQLVAKYVRWNDPSELNTMINAFKRSLNQGNPDITKLTSTLDKVYEACVTIEGLKDSETLSDRLLYNDLAPWLLKVKQMTKSVNSMLVAAAAAKGSEEKWNNYVSEIQPVAALDSAEKYKVYSLEGMGDNIPVGVRQSAASRKYLYPFTKYLLENALGDFFKAPQKAELSFFTNAKGLKSKAIVKNDSVGLDGNMLALEKGEYAGFAMASPRKLLDVTVADSLLANYEVLYSANGKQWNTFTDKETFLKEYVKYVCVRNGKDAAVTFSLPLSALSVVLGEPTLITSAQMPNGPVWNEGGYMHSADLLFDRDYNTYACLNQNQKNGDKYVFELNKLTPIHDVRVCMGTTNGDHMNSGNVEISADGNNWSKIVVKGTNNYDFTIDMAQSLKYTNDMRFCDFDGKGKEAKYVRFTVKSARTNKWLRFYELEVNRQFENAVASATIPSGPIWMNHNKEFFYDGNYTTFVCLNQCQKSGDKYTLKLKKPTPLNEVRVYMGTTNGDHMNKGNVQVSADGKNWKKLFVKGTETYDFSIDMPQSIKYSNEVYFCDFEGDGSEIQYVRFLVSNPRTDKWLRLYEIEVNPNETQSLGECTDHDGRTITTLNDGVAYSGVQRLNESLTYYFNSIQFVKSIEIFQDASATADRPATIAVTSDGQQWTDLGTLSQNHQVVDLSHQGDATALQLSWDGNHSPVIYEIVTHLDENKSAEVTKVENISTTEENLDFAFRGNVLSISSANGIASVKMFTMDGKAVMNYQAAGNTQIQVPTLCNANQTYLVQVVLNNGKKATYKIYCK